MKIFYNAQIRTSKISVFHGRAMNINLAAMSIAGSKMTPVALNMSPPLQWWDKLRYLFHGSFKFHSEEAVLRLTHHNDPSTMKHMLTFSAKELEAVASWKQIEILCENLKVFLPSTVYEAECMHYKSLFSLPRMHFTIDYILEQPEGSPAHYKLIPSAGELDTYFLFRSRRLDVKLKVRTSSIGEVDILDFRELMPLMQFDLSSLSRMIRWVKYYRGRKLPQPKRVFPRGRPPGPRTLTDLMTLLRIHFESTGPCSLEVAERYPEMILSQDLLSQNTDVFSAENYRVPKKANFYLRARAQKAKYILSFWRPGAGKPLDATLSYAEARSIISTITEPKEKFEDWIHWDNDPWSSFVTTPLLIYRRPTLLEKGQVSDEILIKCPFESLKANHHLIVSQPRALWTVKTRNAFIATIDWIVRSSVKAANMRADREKLEEDYQMDREESNTKEKENLEETVSEIRHMLHVDWISPQMIFVSSSQDTGDQVNQANRSVSIHWTKEIRGESSISRVNLSWNDCCVFQAPSVIMSSDVNGDVSDSSHSGVFWIADILGMKTQAGIASTSSPFKLLAEYKMEIKFVFQKRPELVDLTEFHDDDISSVRILVSELRTKLTSSQFHTIVNTLTNNVFAPIPVRSQRSERTTSLKYALQLEVFSGSESTKKMLSLSKKHVNVLRDELHKLRNIQDELYLRLNVFTRKELFTQDEVALIENVTKIQEEIVRVKEELSGAMEVFDIYQKEEEEKTVAENQERGTVDSYHPSKMSFIVKYNLRSITWQFMDSLKQRDCFFSLALVELRGSVKFFDGGLSSHFVEIGDIRPKYELGSKSSSPFSTTTIPSTVITPGLSEGRSWNPSKDALATVIARKRGDIGGMVVYEHMEIKMWPMKVNIIRQIYSTISNYIFVESEMKKKAESVEKYISQLKSENNGSVKKSSRKSAPDLLESIQIEPEVEEKAIDEDTDDVEEYIEEDESIQNEADMLRSMDLTEIEVKRHGKMIKEMQRRAASSNVFHHVKLCQANFQVTYRHEGTKRSKFDLQDVPIKIPELIYTNRTWSWKELTNSLKYDLIRMVLEHNAAGTLKKKLMKSKDKEVEEDLNCDRSEEMAASVRKKGESANRELLFGDLITSQEKAIQILFGDALKTKEN